MTTDAQYCPRCAAALPGAPPTTCTACGYALFVNARPTASLIIVDSGRFLALRRAIEPKAGLWEVPGGFCDGWEHPTQAAVREGREELGVDVRLDHFVGMYVGSYDFQGETLPVLDCFWIATLLDPAIVIDPGESLEYAWFPVSEPPELAFATMNSALRDAHHVLSAA